MPSVPVLSGSNPALSPSIPVFNHSPPDPLVNSIVPNHPLGCSTISNSSPSDPALNTVLLPNSNQPPPPPLLVLKSSSPLPIIHSTSFPTNAPPIPLDQPPIPSQLTLNSITPILQLRPPPIHTPALSLKTTTPKPTPPSLNDLPYDVISVILQKSSTPTIDTSNPFSILDSCTFDDPTLNPSTFARNLQAYSENSTSSYLPPGFEPPIKPSTPLLAEQDFPQEVDQLPTQPSPPSLDPKAQASQVTTGSLVTTNLSLAPAAANNSSTSPIICNAPHSKIHYVNWATITPPKAEGALGIRLISEVNNVSFIKLGWQASTGTQSGLTGSRTVILNFEIFGMQRTLSMAPALGRKFVIWLTTFIKGAPRSSIMVRKSTSGVTPGLKVNPYLIVSLLYISPPIKDYPPYTNQRPGTSVLTFHWKFNSNSLLSFQTSPQMLKSVIQREQDFEKV
ncbi:hypothetical protein MRB53_015855 [Persea americana]|uniref:Uncharacterized protein n=1 Tax=Persea americana TaxID=3435 RepID=A0ACC2M077_PERAE|nr:hypothetical protein MRB53_015855 [Persea americana]